jgi:uncharacterized protein YbjQ (UPF0145 family)
MQCDICGKSTNKNYGKKKGEILCSVCAVGSFSNEEDISNIICTTAPIIEGYQVIETLDVITAECVFGMNIFRDIFASFSDFLGGRSNASQNVLRDARKTCLWELRKEAVSLGANAVIAIDLDYSEISGAGKSMLFLVASGTAVKVQPNKMSE